MQGMAFDDGDFDSDSASLACSCLTGICSPAGQGRWQHVVLDRSLGLVLCNHHGSHTRSCNQSAPSEAMGSNMALTATQVTVAMGDCRACRYHPDAQTMMYYGQC